MKRIFYRMLNHHTERKLFYLFLSLVLLLAFYPFFQKGVFKSPVMVIFLTVSLSAVMYALTYSNKLFYAGLAIGLPAIVLSWINVFSVPTDVTVVGSHVFTMGLYAFSCFSIIHHIFKAHEVESDAVFGAVSVYLIMGIFWATLYSLINYFDPGAFLNAFSDVDAFYWADFLYYSYSNLTTLGLGDIVPVSDLAKSSVAMESVVGVMYIAVLVSKFLGYSQRKR